jgi:hypothetical protein
MCTYKCKECGKVFTQRRIKKHLEREHKKSPTKQNYTTNRLTYYRFRSWGFKGTVSRDSE